MRGPLRPRLTVPGIRFSIRWLGQRQCASDGRLSRARGVVLTLRNTKTRSTNMVVFESEGHACRR